MRAIGIAERALGLMVERVTTRKAFGKLLAQQAPHRTGAAPTH
jgi:alkylation response protein AidB-like acyl-CoA dehydrogenase